MRGILGKSFFAAQNIFSTILKLASLQMEASRPLGDASRRGK